MENQKKRSRYRQVEKKKKFRQRDEFKNKNDRTKERGMDSYKE
jgi:hypothetical protein